MYIFVDRRRKIAALALIIIVGACFFYLNQNIFIGSVVPETASSSRYYECFVKKWPHLEIFLPIAPKDGAFETGAIFLPAFGLFWPRKHMPSILYIGDAERGEEVLRQQNLAITKLTDTILRREGSSRLVYNTLTVPEIKRGWDRQQWLMFWADNFTRSEYVGFVDSDSFLITRITFSDLYYRDGSVIKPIVRPAFSQPVLPSWHIAPTFTKIAIGRKSPFSCMTYFPVILKTEHLPLIREHIQRQMNATTFDEAFARLMVLVDKRIYSQFDIMCAYLFYHKRDDYHWIVGTRDTSYGGPVAVDRVETPEEGDFTVEIQETRRQPGISVHYHSDNLRRDRYIWALRKVVCLSLTPDQYDSAKIAPVEFCRPFVATRFETLNQQEWSFETWKLAGNLSLEQQATRYRQIDKCPHEWDQRLVNILFNETVNDVNVAQWL